MSSVLNFIGNRYVNVFESINHDALIGKSIIYINPFNYFYLKNNLREFQNVHYRTDGIYVTSFIKLLNKTKYRVERQSFDMTSLAPAIFDYCIKNKLSIFFCGASEDDIQKFIKKIQSLYSTLKIDGCISGYLTEDETYSYLENVKSDLVILGLGNKKQENLVARLSKLNNGITYFTCGAFFSQTAKSEGITYYPRFINRFNLRWLYRFYKESYVIKRVAIYYPLFLLSIFKEYFLTRSNE